MRLGLIILIKRNVIGRFLPLNAAEKEKPWNRFRYWLMSKVRERERSERERERERDEESVCVFGCVFERDRERDFLFIFSPFVSMLFLSF